MPTASKAAVKQADKKNLEKDAVLDLLKITDLPEKIKVILEARPDPNSWDNIDIDTVLKGIKMFITRKIKDIELPSQENKDESSPKDEELPKIDACISFLKQLINSKQREHVMTLPRVYSILTNILVCDRITVKTKNQASMVAEKLLKEATGECAMTNFIIANFLLDQTLGKKDRPVAKADIKRVWAINKGIRKVDVLNPACEEFLNKLMASVISSDYLSCKEGRLHIASFLTMEISLVKRIQESIRDKLPTMPKSVATHYGEVYFTAWNNAKPEIREAIEEKCIQDLMMRIFVLKRSNLDFQYTGQIVFAILSHLHNSRRSHSFSLAITKLYMPLLWRSLRSGNPLERCNAAQVFLDVFPLEKPGAGIAQNAQFLERQFKELMDLLLDEYHILRIITIKGACRILSESVECLSVLDVRSLMSTLADDLSNDSSTYKVRVAVFEGFAAMVKDKKACVLLQSILPQMTLHIHDENPKVRRAFVKMLLNLKECEDFMPIKYWDIASINHLAARLELEDAYVGEPLVKLMMSNFYKKGRPLEKYVARLTKLIDMNPGAALKLFQYSYKLLTIEDVHPMIVGMLEHLRRKAKAVIADMEKPGNDSCTENKPAEKNRPKKKRKRKLSTLAEVPNEDNGEDDSIKGINSDSESTGISDERRFVDTPMQNSGMLACVTTLWTVFSHQINLPENDKYRSDFYTMAVACIPLFLRIYKGMPMYYTTVNFASLIPISKLGPVTTISSACISELKQLTEEMPENQIKCLTYSLAAWKRGHEVIDICIEWLDHAFRGQHLNASAIPKAGRKPTKVRFQSNPGKPLLALKLLDILFDDVLTQKCMVSYSYNQIYELMVYLHRIKILLERRMNSDQVLPEPELSDKFLVKCLERYLILMVILHRPDKPPESMSISEEELSPVSTAQTTATALEWAASVLIPKLPSEAKVGDEEPLVVTCLRLVFNTAVLGIKLDQTEKEHCEVVAFFALRLIRSSCDFWFVEPCLSLMNSLCEHAEVYTEKDEWNLIKVMASSLFSQCLKTLENPLINYNNFSVYVQNKQKMQNDLISLPTTINRVFGSDSELFIEAFHTMVDTCIRIITQEIVKIDLIESLELLKDLPVVAAEILKLILMKDKLKDCLLQSLIKHTFMYRKEGYLLAGCISLLNTIVLSSRKRFDQLLVERAIQKAFVTLMAFKQPISTNVEDSFNGDKLTMDVIKVGEPLLIALSQVVGCSLLPPPRVNFGN